MTDDEQGRGEPGGAETAPDVAGEGQKGPPPLALPDGPVLVVAAHPDDADFGCGGSMARLVAEGRRVTVAVVTDGTEGGSDPSMPDEALRDRREAEQRAALDTYGVREVLFLRFPDGRLEPNLAARRAIVRAIRQVKPATVFAHDPTAHIFEGYINHPDHRAAGIATLDAVFPSAGNPRAFRELLAEGLEAHAIKVVYLFYTAQANAWIEVTGDPLARKLVGLRHHESQIDSSWEMEPWIRKEAERAGTEAGVPAAEGFRRIILAE